MEFRCEDLPQYGVHLVPPTSPEYDTLVDDIRQRLEHPVAGSPPSLRKPSDGPPISPDGRSTSAILVNRSQFGIVLIQQIWTFREVSGRSYSSSIGGVTGPSMLLPFGFPENLRKLYGYWHVILPGSKRCLTSDGEILGDNSDVRPPDPEEIWAGGIVGARAGRDRRARSFEEVTLTLDGVFFTDGGFAGPNRRGLWDQVLGRAEGYRQAAQIAVTGHNGGRTPGQIFAEIEQAIGPGGERPPIPRFPHDGWSADECRRSQAERVAFLISMIRKSQGDVRTLQTLMSWANAPVPRFHKL